MYILAKRNYKVYANIGESMRITQSFTVPLDTEAGYGFIGLTHLPLHGPKEIQKLGCTVNIRNASGKRLPIVNTIRLTVQIGTSVEHGNFYVTENSGR